MRVMPDGRPLSTLLSRPFAALMLFGAMGIVAMVVTFSVARGVATRPAPLVVNRPPAAAAASPSTSKASAPPTVDPGQAEPVYAPPPQGNGNGSANGQGGDGGGGD